MPDEWRTGTTINIQGTKRLPLRSVSFKTVATFENPISHTIEDLLSSIKCYTFKAGGGDVKDVYIVVVNITDLGICG